MRARGALALRSLSLRSRIGMQPLRKVKCVAIYLRHTRVSRNFTHSCPHALALATATALAPQNATSTKMIDKAHKPYIKLKLDT
jgi:hypothetical protein